MRATTPAPGPMPGSSFTVTPVWTSLVLAGYLVYTWRAGRPLSPLWTFPVRRWSMGLATLTVAAVTLAIAMPTGERTHADLLRITFIAFVGEELVFRGLVWDIVETAARRITSSPDRLTVILTGSLFALSHAQYHDFRPSAVMAGQIGYTLVAGLVLGWARLRSRGLPGPNPHTRDWQRVAEARVPFASVGSGSESTTSSVAHLTDPSLAEGVGVNDRSRQVEQHSSNGICRAVSAGSVPAAASGSALHSSGP